MNIKQWNTNIIIQSTPETSVKAVPGDIVINLAGYLFLVQRKNDYNNVIFAAIKPKLPLYKVFNQFFNLLKFNSIQFIRVEGNNKRYRYFDRIFPVSVVKDYSVTDRNVIYIKIY